MYVDTAHASQTAFHAPLSPAHAVPAGKPPVFSLAGLVAWLETQDPRTTYNYSSCTDCLLTRYFRAQGLRAVFCGPTRVHFRRFFLLARHRSIPFEMNHVAIRHGTYGRALAHARAILASQNECVS